MRATEPRTATAIETTQDALVLVLGEREVRLPWEKCSRRLAAATAGERMQAELHWPLIDEDLSVNGLLRELHE